MSNQKSVTTYEDLEGYFYYTKIQTPDYGYNPQKLPLSQLDPQEQCYKVDVAVTKETYNEFVKRFPKKKTSPLENSDFLEKYKVSSVPYPDQPLQYVLSFKQKVFKKDGNLMHESMRPRVYTFEGSDQVDITETTLIGNGSSGVVRYRVWDRGSEIPLTVNLYALCVQNLIPYETKNTQDPRSFTKE